MATRIHFLCYAVTALIASQSNAQSAISSVMIPSYTSPLYTAQSYTNQGLNLYRQNQKLPKGTNIVSLPYLPKIFPNGIPNIPQVPQSSLSIGGKLKPLSGLPAFLLNPQPVLPRIPQLQIRSADAETKNKEEKSVKSIDPIHEETDEQPKLVIGSSPTPSNATTTEDLHNQKIRSPDHDENADDFDYLSKAANPSDEKESKGSIGHMFKKVGSGIKHAVEKIDSAFHSSHSPSNAKESENDNDYVPYQAWSHNSENNPVGQRDSVAEIMQEYLKMMNVGRNLENSQYQIPKSVIVGMNNVLNEFKESLAKSSLMQKENSASQNINENPNDDDPSKLLQSKHMPSQFDHAKNEHSEVDQSPINKMWDSAYTGKSENSATSATDFGQSQGKSGYNQFYQHPNGYGYQTGYYGGYYPNGYYGNSPMPNPYSFGPGFYPGYNPTGMIWNGGYYQRSSSSDTSSIQPNGGAMTQPLLSRNYRQMPSYNVGGSSADITNSALNLAQEILKGNVSKIPTSAFVMGSNIAGITNPRLKLFPLFKRSSSDNIWNSATGLAGNIANVAMNPSQANNGQILGSIGSIWSSANNLAGNIGQVATNPSGTGNGQLVGSSNGGEYSPENYPSQSVWNSATNLAGNIAKIATNPGDAFSKENNPVGSVSNSATNLADSIIKSPWSLGKLQNGQLLGASNVPGSVVNTATDLASKITNIAMNPGSVGSSQLTESANPMSTIWNPSVDSSRAGQMMQPYESTYDTGYFPRISSAGQIWNSASQLADSIVNTAVNPGVIGSGRMHQPVRYYGWAPLSSISKSATDLAGSISNADASPKDWTPFMK